MDGAVAARVPGATPFQSPAWLMAWWSHFGTGMPRVLTARAGEGAGSLGVLPLYVLARAGVRKLLPIGIGLSDYIDALVDPAWPEAGEAMLAAIADIPDWDECHLPDLPEGGVLHGARGPAGLAERRSDSGPCPVLTLPESADALDAMRPAQDAARCAAGRSRGPRRRAASRIETADADTLASMLDDLFRLHEAALARARRAGGVLRRSGGAGVSPRRGAGARGRGMLRLYRLRIGETRRGGLLRVCCAGPGLCLSRRVRSGRCRGSAPARRSLRHAIGEAIAEGAREFDFLRGGEDYKYAWGAVDRRNAAADSGGDETGAARMRTPLVAAIAPATSRPRSR